MTTPNQTTAEQDGIIHGIASACVAAIREAADSASPEQFIRLATAQVEQAGEFSAERVAACLHTTLKALHTTSAELRGDGYEPR